MHEFKPGDVVRLRSGGPRMTVVTPQGSRTLCAWFSGAHEFNVGEIPTVALEPAEAGPERTVPLAEVMRQVRERGESESR